VRFAACPCFGGFQRVGHQHGDGHRANAAGNRCQSAGNSFHHIEIDVTNELAGTKVLIFDPVDPDIDHRRAWLHPICANHLRTPDSGHQNVRAAGQTSDIFGPTMSNGDGGVRGQEQMADRPANDG
jgi:hypothetical protein